MPSGGCRRSRCRGRWASRQNLRRRDACNSPQTKGTAGTSKRVCDAVIRSRPRVFPPAACGSGTRGGKAAHATEPIAKAVIAHRTVQGELACIPDVYESKRELAGEARRLLESIQSFLLARKERRHSTSKVRCTRRVVGRGYLFIALFVSSASAYRSASCSAACQVTHSCLETPACCCCRPYRISSPTGMAQNKMRG
jgi:hypothetical protein